MRDVTRVGIWDCEADVDCRRSMHLYYYNNGFPNRHPSNKGIMMRTIIATAVIACVLLVGVSWAGSDKTDTNSNQEIVRKLISTQDSLESFKLTQVSGLCRITACLSGCNRNFRFCANGQKQNVATCQRTQNACNQSCNSCTQ